MPSTYTYNLGLEKPATGEQAGTWGTTVNSSYDFLDTAIDGNVAIALSASGYTLMTTPGLASEGRNKVIVFTGALTADASITIAPNTAEKIYYISNQTSGGFNLVISQGTGATYKIQAGKSAVVYTTGGGGTASVYGLLANLQVDTLAVTAAAVTNLTATGTNTLSGTTTINAALVLGLGGDAAGDMYYRASSGQVARVGAGAAGQVLSMGAGNVPAWVTAPPPSIGMAVVNAQPYGVFVANSAGQLAQDSYLQWVTGRGLAIGNVPANNLLTVGGGSPTTTIELNDANGHTRQLLYTTLGVGRWGLKTTTDVESGVGSDTTACSLMLVGAPNDGSVANLVFQAYRNGHIAFGAASGDRGQVTIWNQKNTNEALNILGAVSQSANLTVWRDSNSNILAYVDAAGNGIFPNLGGFLKLDANRRLNINATQTMCGTIQVGADNNEGATIALEANGSIGTYPTGSNIIRFFQRAGQAVVFQFAVGAQLYYLYCLMTTSGAQTWYVATSPPL